MLLRILPILALFLLLLCPAGTPQAAEIIHEYDVDITINRNGGLYITETIEVTAEGNQIKRGIYRDFPLYRRTFLGGILPAEYDILSVKRDGKREPHHTEKSEGNLRLYIGEASHYLPTGKRYTYEITYRVPEQVFFYDGYDELYWNAIGTGWDFPIERASVDIALPRGATLKQFSAYTGKALSKNSNVRARQERSRLFIEAKQALAPHEGVTVAVSFPKGFITEPAGMTGITFFWKQHPGLKTMLVALIILIAYYYIAWRKFGRDPKKRSLTPFYDPPEGVSPAMAAFINTMGSSGKQKNMTSAIMSLAAKGYLTVEETEEDKYGIKFKAYTLSRTEQTPQEGPQISEDEQIIYDNIETELTISPGSEELVDTANNHHKKLDKLCRKKYYHINGWWWLGGLIPLIGALTIISFDPHIPAGFLWMGFMFLLMFGGISLGAMIYAIKQIITGPPSKKAGGVFLFIWACIFSMGGVLGFGIMSTMISWLVLACILIMVGLFVFMHKIMKAPTEEGRAVMDHIDGLKYYMEAVEEKILKKFDPPQMSRELYEKYLPYAVALGVESKWADKFALATAGAATAGAAVAAHAVPSWYSGTNASSMESFSASSMVSSFGSTISAASSSNASGGGGSVGGGGGGGW